MIFGMYPISELGVLWLESTLCVALVWLFLRTRLMPVIVATAIVYFVTILAWMSLVHFDVPTLWELRLEGHTYPVIDLGVLGLVTAFFVLKSLKRRHHRREAKRSASMADAKSGTLPPERGEGTQRAPA